MGKQHLDFLTLMTRAHIFRRRCDAPSYITSGFMDAADDLAERSVRASLTPQMAIGLNVLRHQAVAMLIQTLVMTRTSEPETLLMYA
ncbi:hypothetical protein D3C85_1709660 [compost metagenome]